MESMICQVTGLCLAAKMKYHAKKKIIRATKLHTCNFRMKMKPNFKYNYTNFTKITNILNSPQEIEL